MRKGVYRPVKCRIRGRSNIGRKPVGWELYGPKADPCNGLESWGSVAGFEVDVITVTDSTAETSTPSVGPGIRSR